MATPAKSIKIPDHNLQVDPDGVLRWSKCGTRNADGTTNCMDKLCASERAIRARNYISENNLVFNSDWSVVSNNVTDLSKTVSQLDTELATLKEQVLNKEYYLRRAQEALKLAKSKEAVEQAAKAKYEEERKRKATERILTQVTQLSPERIAQLAVEAGLDRLGPQGDTARKILNEALSTLKASYWIKSKELSVAATIEQPWSPVAGLEKFQAVKNADGFYAAVTGVCSVGALALAKAVLNDIPVKAFSKMVKGDRGMHIATVALAWAIRDYKDWKFEMQESATDTVVHWNDAPDTTREEVIAVWEHALRCPFLDMDDEAKLYYLGAPMYRNFRGAVYADVAAAQAAVEQIKAAKRIGEPGRLDPNDVSDKIARAAVRSGDWGWYPETVANLQVIEDTNLPKPMLATV